MEIYYVGGVRSFFLDEILMDTWLRAIYRTFDVKEKKMLEEKYFEKNLSSTHLIFVFPIIY